MERGLHHADGDPRRGGLARRQERGGLPRRVRRELLARRPARLTYVSCHAATLARDLHQLTAAYRLESVVLLDMFPQSGHMEAVAQLVLDPEKAPPPQDDGE